MKFIIFRLFQKPREDKSSVTDADVESSDEDADDVEKYSNILARRLDRKLRKTEVESSQTPEQV